MDRILQQPVNDIIAMVKKKEMARDAHLAASQNGMSQMKKKKKEQSKQKLFDSDKLKQAPCPHCKKMNALHPDGSFGWNSKPFEMCVNCFSMKRAKKPDDKSVSFNADSKQHADIGIIIAHMSAISTSNANNDSHVWSGLPVKIHLKDGAVPYNAQTAWSIPLHWQTPVKEQYERDR